MKKTLNHLILLFTGLLLFSLNNTVKAQPDIDITPVSHDYGEVIVGNFVNYYFTFSNTGDETLHITNIEFTDPAFSIQYTEFTIQPGASGQLPIKFQPTQSKDYSAKMMVYSDDPDENPFYVYLSGKGTAPLTSGWEWINTGFDYILVDLNFPQGQNKVGFAV